MPTRRRTRIPLNSFASFEVTARHLNMRIAGEEMGVTAAAVSHQIAKLEDFVGSSLLVRDGRRLALTPQGSRLAADLGHAFELIDAGINLLGRGPEAQESITICSSLTVASFWLMPLTCAYRRHVPAVDIRVLTRTQQGEYDKTDADLTIAEFLPESSRVSVPLLDAEIVPVCAPSLLGQHPGATLETLPLIWIDYSQTGKRTAPITWDTYFREFGIARKFDKQGVSVHPSSATHAALAGLGVQLGRRPIVELLLKSGALVQVGPACAQQHRFYLWTRPLDQLRPEVRAFRSWLLRRAKA